MKKIDLNVDLAEGFDHDFDLLQFATSANVCCGVHAGDAELTRATVEYCLTKGVRIGVHPGFPDRNSMGRAPLEPGQELEYLDSVFLQIRRFIDAYPATYIKPHGALYNATGLPISIGWDSLVKYPTAKTPYEAGGVALSNVPGTGMLMMALRVTKVGLMGLPGTLHEEMARRAGRQFIAEGFADRRYQEDGRLVPRIEPGAVLQELAEILEQVEELAERVDSICIHGDTPDAVDIAEAVFHRLKDAGYEISA